MQFMDFKFSLQILFYFVSLAYFISYLEGIFEFSLVVFKDLAKIFKPSNIFNCIYKFDVFNFVLKYMYFTCPSN